jgi:hypothetical protein
MDLLSTTALLVDSQVLQHKCGGVCYICCKKFPVSRSVPPEAESTNVLFRLRQLLEE